MAYGQQCQHARAQLGQSADRLTHVVATICFSTPVGENHEQCEEEHLDLAHFKMVFGTLQLSFEQVCYASIFWLIVGVLQFLRAASGLGVSWACSIVAESSSGLLLLKSPEPTSEPALIPEDPKFPAVP
jgi:hypothetical protein